MFVNEVAYGVLLTFVPTLLFWLVVLPRQGVRPLLWRGHIFPIATPYEDVRAYAAWPKPMSGRARWR